MTSIEKIIKEWFKFMVYEMPLNQLKEIEKDLKKEKEKETDIKEIRKLENTLETLNVIIIYREIKNYNNM